MRWFRLYDDVLNDPKVQRLDGETFKFWVNVLCLASKHGGVLPDITDIAFQIRVSVADCNAKIDALKSAGLLDGNKRLTPHGWEKRQYKSDTSTDRVKRFRERSRNATVTVNETVPDTDTESDTDNINIHIKEKKILKEKKSRSAGSAEFEEFWKLYPRQINKAMAQKAFAKATAKATPELICEAVKNYQFSEDQQFIPHPATWLNQERWEGIEPPKEARQGKFTQEQLDKFEQERLEWLKEFNKAAAAGQPFGMKPPSIT